MVAAGVAAGWEAGAEVVVLILSRGSVGAAAGAGEVAPLNPGTELSGTQSAPPSGHTRSSGTTCPAASMVGNDSCGYGPYVVPSRAM